MVIKVCYRHFLSKLLHEQWLVLELLLLVLAEASIHSALLSQRIWAFPGSTFESTAILPSILLSRWTIVIYIHVGLIILAIEYIRIVYNI